MCGWAGLTKTQSQFSYDTCRWHSIYVCQIHFFSAVPTLSLSSSTYTVSESDGSLQVCVLLNTPVNFVLDLLITATNTGSATSGNASHDVRPKINIEALYVLSDMHELVCQSTTCLL